MARIKVVLGASFGDEGKGVMVNYLTHQANTSYTNPVLNILFNGGVQRGHTVNGHVFHCFGAGALEGATTYYHRDFIVNPMGWFFETIDLRDNFNCQPKLIIDCDCRVTTTYDIAINRLLEQKRGNARHGSCGLGILETKLRSADFPIYVKDLTDEFSLYQKLCYIRDVYFPRRCAELDINPTDAQKVVEGNLFDDFMTAAHQMISNNNVHIYYFGLPSFCRSSFYETIIFEGGQGLLLSETNMEDFPYLTPSITGSDVIAEEISKIIKNDDLIEVCYMTRSYLTRHGAGPLPNECTKEDINSDIVDTTNIPNDWQGSLRFGYLDINSLSERIKKDFKCYEQYNIPALLSIGITHLDYTNNCVQVGQSKQVELNQFKEDIKANKVYGFDNNNNNLTPCIYI